MLCRIPPTISFSYFSVCRVSIQTPFLTYSCSIPLSQPTSCSNLLTQLLSFLITEGVKHEKQQHVDVFLIKRSVACSYFNNCQRVRKYVVIFKNIKNAIWYIFKKYSWCHRNITLIVTMVGGRKLLLFFIFQILIQGLTSLFLTQNSSSYLMCIYKPCY